MRELPRANVHRIARREADDDANRLGGIVLRDGWCGGNEEHCHQHGAPAQCAITMIAHRSGESMIES